MSKRATLKASDEDRDRVADHLRKAASEGRLLAHELEERVAAALRARTYGELDAVVADLPRGPLDRRRPSSLRSWVVPAAGLVIAIPIALAVIAVVAVVVAGLVATWALWLFVCWWLFGHRYRGRRRRGPGYRGRHQIYDARRL